MKVENKELTEFEEDFHAVTILCYLKVNKEKLKLTQVLLAHNLYNSLMLILWQITMLSCMLYSMLKEPSPNFSNDFIVFLVKFPCVICLHLKLYP